MVWSAIAGFGIHKTSGAVGTLQTGGFDPSSRNPQYVADITLVLGWMVLSAVFVVGLEAIVVLTAAPFSEEPWLRSHYGSDFDKYSAEVRRVLRNRIFDALRQSGKFGLRVRICRMRPQCPVCRRALSIKYELAAS